MAIFSGIGIEMANILLSIVMVRGEITRLLSNVCTADHQRGTSPSSSNSWHIWSWLNLAGGKLKSDASLMNTNEIIFLTKEKKLLTYDLGKPPKSNSHDKKSS